MCSQGDMSDASHGLVSKGVWGVAGPLVAQRCSWGAEDQTQTYVRSGTEKGFTWAVALDNSNENPFDLIERQLVTSAIIELGGAS
jgi:hypothetical protein